MSCQHHLLFPAMEFCGHESNLQQKIALHIDRIFRKSAQNKLFFTVHLERTQQFPETFFKHSTDRNHVQ